MENKHTSGPWKTEPHDDHIMITDVQTQMSAIARVGLPASWDWDRRQVVAANARLISAAPDLLAALVEAQKQFDFIVSALAQGHTVSISSVQNCAAQARATIAKATP